MRTFLGIYFFSFFDKFLIKKPDDVADFDSCLVCNIFLNVFFFFIFSALQKHDAAKAVFSKVPEDSMKEICSQWAAVGQSVLPAEDENAIREHLCIRAYLVCNENNNHFQKS